MDISGATAGVIVAVLVAIALYLIWHIWQWWRDAPNPEAERKKEEFWKSIR